uniref:Gfo/Idh/MocA family protein n=1 Tax=Cellvibrio fontiphilus TaxID=1815559 RepID=UPI002B4BCA70|nr:Gfo/Idh/MocA family oxidoreductase [Cellvibrio fontiphilus]
MQTIRWGIIGVGNVCEVKSGPGFYKNPASQLLAVMRRDADKARDFAQRHNVPHWYNNAAELLNNPDIDAVYIATPPAQHLDYALAALAAGKHVYIEKPVTLNARECRELIAAANRNSYKVCVAHYRRALPHFIKIAELIAGGVIGAPLIAQIDLLRPAPTKHAPDNWRLNPAISGGGLFHDLAPHQLDLMVHWFGPVKNAAGFALNQRQLTSAADLVQGWAQLQSGVALQGRWHFGVAPELARDSGEIIGTQGSIQFNFFGDGTIKLTTASGTQTLALDYPAHVQQPLIAQVNQYFRGDGSNPCSLEDALASMELIDNFSSPR